MNRLLSLAAVLFFGLNSSLVSAQNFLVVDQSAWPGKFITLRGTSTTNYWQRGAVNDRIIPRIRSLTNMPDGSIAFCSGLDRSIMVLGPAGEQELHHGGYLARQVRTDTNGDLFWSGVETPQNSNPLPDGFIYRRKATTGQVETLLTFSQSNTDHDWWGAFDVRGGQVYVATMKSPAKLYRIADSIPQHIATFSFPISSFRIIGPTAILAADGQGRIYRVDDWQEPERADVVAQREFAISDFLAIP